MWGRAVSSPNLTAARIAVYKTTVGTMDDVLYILDLHGPCEATSADICTRESGEFSISLQIAKLRDGNGAGSQKEDQLANR
jgi:hypothetical protein